MHRYTLIGFWALLLVFMTACDAPILDEWKRTGTIVVTFSPDEANVSVTPLDAQTQAFEKKHREAGAVEPQQVGSSVHYLKPPGKYRVSVSKEGFDTQTRDVNLQASELIALTIYLDGDAPGPGDPEPPDPDPGDPDPGDPGPPEPTDPVSLSGVIFEDSNENGSQDGGEEGLGGWTVYLDANDNALLDGGETSVESAPDGSYEFADLSAGEYIVRQQMPFGWRNVSGGDASPSGQSVRLGRGARKALDEKDLPQIVGGADAIFANYPFMAALATENGSRFCGGALISDSWVLTAAHCSVDNRGNTPDTDEVRLLLGTDNLADEDGLLLRVAQVIVHPDFERVDKGHDIAVWQLEEPVDMTANDLYSINMLDEEQEDLAAGDVLATTIGWGNTQTATPFPDQLQQVHVPILDAQQCRETVPEAENFETQLCAAVPEGGIDSCQGDSGGPLMIRFDDEWHHAGITSYGLGCALPGSPGIYARTSALSDWAKDNAVETSNVYVLNLGEDDATGIDFGNKRTTRALEGEIEPRWQLTNLVLPQKVEADTELELSWRIIDEGSRSYECSFDPDGLGSLEAEPVFCQAGENAESFSGFAEGVYLPTLNVSADTTRFDRLGLTLAGDPASFGLDGALTEDDPLDPDYFGDYYIDYLEIKNIDPNQAVLVRMTDSEFSPFFDLYDLNERDPEEGGGFVRIDKITEDGFAFFPQEGISYLVGVSTFDEEETGAYRIEVVNGELEAVDLDE